MTRYDAIGKEYAQHRIPGARLAARIAGALGDAETVLSVGAGAGSYEPRDRRVLAVEPSEAMIAQRPSGSAPVVQASAEALPVADQASGRWRDRYGHLLSQDTLDAGYRLVVRRGTLRRGAPVPSASAQPSPSPSPNGSGRRRPRVRGTLAS